jgi:hypothetical protein
MRHRLALLVLALAAAIAAAVVTIPAQAATSPYCGITWGSLAKSAGTSAATAARITGVRAGQHACYDRLVVDLANAPAWASYQVAYGTVRGVASGNPVAVAGGAALQITMRAHGENLSVPDPAHVVSVAGYRTFRQVVWAGSFEGTTVFGLGVRARLPFRVLTLSGPGAGQTRLVIDVAHLW